MIEYVPKSLLTNKKKKKKVVALKHFYDLKVAVVRPLGCGFGSTFITDAGFNYLVI